MRREENERRLFCGGFRLRFFKLFADCDPAASPYQLRKICVESVMRKARDFDRLGFARCSASESNAKDVRGCDSILAETLVKIAYAEK